MSHSQSDTLRTTNNQTKTYKTIFFSRLLVTFNFTEYHLAIAKLTGAQLSGIDVTKPDSGVAVFDAITLARTSSQTLRAAWLANYIEKYSEHT